VSGGFDLFCATAIKAHAKPATIRIGRIVILLLLLV